MLPPSLLIGPARALIADLDGTLINTYDLMVQGHYATACHFLSNLGIDQARLPDRITYTHHLRRALGQPAIAMLRQVMGELYPPQTDEHAAVAGLDDQQMLSHLLRYQDSLAGELTQPVPGLETLLEELAQQRMALAVVTNCQPHGALRALGLGLEHCGLPASAARLYSTSELPDQQRIDQLCQAIATQWNLPAVTLITAGHVRAPKPDPAGIALALSGWGLRGQEVAYLGDHPIDMQAAQAAGVNLRLGITTGVSTAEQLQQAGARLVVNHLEQLHFSPAAQHITLPHPRRSPENLTSPL